jgi:hypothetical protein
MELSRQNLPRNSAAIAAEIWKLIPEDKTVFREDIMEFIKKSAYRSPELRRSKITWMELQLIMHKHLPIRDQEWKNKIIDLYTGISIEDSFENNE